MATINEMRQVATQIENETQVGGNTASRVGGLFNDIVDKLEGDEESITEFQENIDGNSTTIKMRRNTAAGFTATNPVLAEGELGFEIDRKRYKMGDGVTAWNSLEYRSEELDATPTRGSEKGVMSGGVYNALEPFNDLLYEKYDVQTTDGTTYNNLIIDTSQNPNIFETGAGTQYKGVLIPVVRGFTYVLEYSATQYTGVALIKNSAPAAGDAVIYATGEINHYDSPTVGGIKYIYEITEDNLFLYVRNDTGNVARTWPATFYRYNEDSKKVLMKDDVQHNVTESSSAVVDSAGICRFVKNNASLQPSDALQMTKISFNLSQFTWANIKVGGVSDSKRVRSSIVAIPSDTKSIKLTLASTGTYGYQIFVFMTNAYSEPYYTIADWEGTSNNITLEVPECVGEGAYMCIYGHRIDNTNVSTSGFSSNIESLKFYTIQQRDIISAKKKSIRILFLGNSLTQDAVAWLPYVLQNGEVDVDYSLIDLYNGGFTLAQQWSAIQSKTAFEIASVCQNVIGWTNYNRSKTLDDILDEYQFDILVLQEYFNYQTEPDLTAFENIVSYITERSSCPFEVVSLIHAPLRSDATNVYNRTVAGNQAILNGTCCSSLMNPGTAIYDALSTDLDSLGTRGHLSPDGTHAQEGLPCVLQSLNLLGWIYKKLGIASGVVNFPMSTDMSTIYLSLHIPGANGAVEGGNFEQRKLATKVAAASIRELQKIELGLS